MTGACSLFVSVADDEFTGGAANDAAPGTPERSVAPGAEGGPVSDGGGDPNDGGSTTPDGCDATFCDSFDDGPLGARWGQMQTYGGGELSLAASTIGPPYALRVRLTSSGTAAERAAFLGKTFPLPQRARCSLDVFAGPGLNSDEDIDTRAEGSSWRLP